MQSAGCSRLWSSRVGADAPYGQASLAQLGTVCGKRWPPHVEKPGPTGNPSGRQPRANATLWLDYLGPTLVLWVDTHCQSPLRSTNTSV